MSADYFDPRFPNADYLKEKAKSRMPAFAFDYLEGGCIDEKGLKENLHNLEAVKLGSPLIRTKGSFDPSLNLLGRRYQYPFGIAPIGLQGLMWPNAPQILAKSAAELEVPYILSTVSSASLEEIAEIGNGYCWFQFYNPTLEEVRADLLQRASHAGYEVLVVTVDVPTFGYRPKDIRNGLSMPPKITWRTVSQMLSCPSWLMETAVAGKPEMKTLLPYMAPGTPASEFHDFMNNTVMGPVDFDGLKKIRDVWKGKLVVKGISGIEDADACVALGVDGIVVSNHGARQLDAGPNLLDALVAISGKHRSRVEIIYDSGLRSGTDLAKVLASGASFGLFGRLFVYAAAALGRRGGSHAINMIALQLTQVAQQLGCETPSAFASCLQS